MASALVLTLHLPKLHPRLARARKFIVLAVLLIAVILTMGTWVTQVVHVHKTDRSMLRMSGRPVSAIAI